MELEQIDNLPNNEVKTFQKFLKPMFEMFKLRCGDWLILNSSQYRDKDQGKVEEELVAFTCESQREIEGV